MDSFAVIETGGKQYKVSAGKKIKVEKISKKEGEVFALDHVLLRVEKGEVSIGMPHIAGGGVEVKVVRHGRDKKKLVFRYHSKTRYRKKKGHRQHFTELEIVKV